VFEEARWICVARTICENIMANKHVFTLLRLVSRNADSSFLLRQGLRYSQISALLGDVMREGLISHENNKLVITEAGRKYLASASNVRGRKRKGERLWIAADNSYRIKQIPEEEIYLPSVNDSKHLGDS
jgi:hypothetical protein